MDSKTFVDMCMDAVKKTGGKKKRVGFPEYAMSSKPGAPRGGAIFTPPPAAPAGDGCACDCGGAACGGDCGGACGESVSVKEFNACLESISQQYPESDIVKQIQDMFKSMVADAGKQSLYHGADGCKYTPAESKCDSATEAAISALAAACEASLSAFKQLTGFDYCQFRK